MSLLTELTRITDVLLFEEGEEFNFVRDQITLVSGGAACVVGQVLGQITMGAATSAANGAGGGGANTGNGTCVVDVTTPLLANAMLGIYTLQCTVAGTNSATFRLTDPRGRVLKDYSFSGSGGSFTTDDQIKVAVTDGSTDFIVGDGFKITVAAGSGKWIQVDPAGFDGRQNAAGVCLVKADPSSADTLAVAVTRGPAIFKLNGFAWTSGMTTPQKTAAIAQLAALGMPTRTDYGV